MSFSLPRGNSEGWFTCSSARVTCLNEITFLYVNRKQKLPWGKNSFKYTYYLSKALLKIADTAMCIIHHGSHLHCKFSKFDFFLWSEFKVDFPVDIFRAAEKSNS